MSEFELASYEAGDRDDYLGLLDKAWGGAALSPEEFDWWFARNPAGSLMSVARRDGEVVGVAGHSLFRMALGGEEQVASFSVHATTAKDARGLGIFRALEEKHEREAQERGVAVVLAFASAPTAPLFLGPLGWTEIAKYRVWARFLPGSRVREETGGALEVAADVAADWPNHVIRDADYLRWRYLDSPRNYKALESEGGHAVVGRKGGRRTRVGLIADLVAPRREVRGLLRRAIRTSRAEQILIGLPAPEHRGAYASLGFIPTRFTLHFMGKALAGRLDTDPKAWRFTLGDTDFF